jgi:SAM-dependent methyltransferase
VLLARTRKRIKFAMKNFVFDAGNMQEVVNTRRRHALEDCMGFRGQWEEHRRFQLAFLKEQGLCPAHSLLEIGCGPLTGGVPIIEFLEPGKYVGIDIRSSALDLAWGEVAAAGLSARNPRLVCSSSFGSRELADEKFDFVLSFSVLYHLSDEVLRGYFLAVANRLQPDGRCFAQINTTVSNSTWLQFPFLRRTAAQYAGVAAQAGLDTKPLGTIEGLGFHLPGEERRNEMLKFTPRDVAAARARRADAL